MQSLSLLQASLEPKRHKCLGSYPTQHHAHTHCLPSSAVCRIVGGRWMRRSLYTQPIAEEKLGEGRGSLRGLWS